MRSHKARIVCETFANLFMTNWAIYFVVAMFLGGTAMQSKVEGGQYYLHSHGTYTQVSRETYRYSLVHGYITLVSWPLGVTALFVVAISAWGEQRRIRDRCRSQTSGQECRETEDAADAEIDLTKPPGLTWTAQDNGVTVVRAGTRSQWVLAIGTWTVTILGFGVLFWAVAIRDRELVPTGIFAVFCTIFGLFAVVGSVMAACGRTEVRIEGESGSVFVGALGIGRTRRFSLPGECLVREALRPQRARGAWTGVEIVCGNDRPFFFGTMLRPEQRRFVVLVMKKAIANLRRNEEV